MRFMHRSRLSHLKGFMPTVLIVEDHKDYRQAVRRFLEASKVKADLLEASTGEEGVAIAKERKPDIVLMDFKLGGINGIEAASQIKSELPHCSIIILTMFDVKEVEALSDRNIVKAFISKADLCDKLVPSMNKILNSLL